MNSSKNERIFFWHFFHKIEKELSYERWIDKYKLFIRALDEGYIPYETDFASFRRFCKTLYLQDINHEARFDELLTEAIQKEKEKLIQLLDKIVTKSDTQSNDPSPNNNIADSPPTLKKTPLEKEEGTVPVDKKRPKPETAIRPQTKYFHPNINEEVKTENEDVENMATSRTTFLHTDEYFPLTRREMVKTWQYLRRVEKKGISDQLDIPATVKKVAREGLFTEPVFQLGAGNRIDTLMIFADVRGSMAPFHELSRRLIQTLKTEGGHPNAPVYYFQDFPTGFLFEKNNLTKPIPIKTVLQKGNKQATIAFIISDGGAARGGFDKVQNEARLNNTLVFLNYLRQTVAHIIWVNPMPSHRWWGTTAELLIEKVNQMIPVLEEEDLDFQNTIRLILNKRIK